MKGNEEAGWVGAIAGSIGAGAAVVVNMRLGLPLGLGIGLIAAGAEAGLLLDPGYRRLVRGILNNTKDLLCDLKNRPR